PENEHAEHDEDRHYWPAYEDFRKVHEAGAASVIVTLVPGARRKAPRTTTLSPLATGPAASTDMSPSVRVTTTLRISAVMSGLTTYTNWPLGPVCSAREGTTMAF